MSRESVFLLNNLFLTAFTVTVLVGTLYPLVAEAARGVKVSVGEPFFNEMTLPICAALLFLMGVGPALPWRRASSDVIRRQLMPPAIAAVVGAVVAFAVGARSAYALAAYGFAAFALTANVREFVSGTMARRRAHGESPVTALLRLVGGNRRRHGGYIAHLGVICVTLGIATSATFRSDREATLTRGQSLTLHGYTIRLNDVYGREEPQRQVVAAGVSVLRGGREVGRLEPRMNFYPTSEQPVPSPAVRSRPSGDVYVNLMAFAQDGSNATLRVIVEPMVPWIWTGGLIIVLGALVSMGGARERVPAPVGKLAWRQVPPAAAEPFGGAS